MDDLKSNLYKTRWALIAVGLPVAGAFMAFEKIFR
jgi:hypothetical protein